MPNRNGTGPEGKGAMTGRKMGNCSGENASPRNGQGNGCGRGRGNGRNGRGNV